MRDPTCRMHPGERFPCSGCRTVVDTIKARLADPHDVSERLGIKRRKGEGWICPAHGGACLSLTRGPDRTLRVKCFACPLSGDLLDLLAAVEGVDRDDHFAEVVKRGAELAGITLDPGAPLPPLPRRQPPAPPRPYPPAGDVVQLWKSSSPVVDDPAAVKWCEGRGLEPFAVEDRNLARVLPVDVALPGWASIEGRPWTSTGHRLVFPVFDSAGAMRSLRATQIEGEPDPAKRRPPAGYAARRLILADPLGQLLLAGKGRAGWPDPLRIIVAEGEPDFLTWATRYSDADEDAPAVVGVLSGGWTAEHAARVPDGARVILRTDHDDAGDRYAEDITATLAGRCDIRETDPAGRAERRRTRPQREAERRAQARSGMEVRP